MKKNFLSLIFILLINFSVAARPCMRNCIAHGFYLGLGGSWNTIDETFDSDLFSSTNKRAIDHYFANFSRLVPVIDVGYWRPLCGAWLWGITGQWKYLHYLTLNDNSSRGQYIPNATFSSINFFGPDVHRDFTSQTQINNELIALVYGGMQVRNGFVYLGIGPVLLDTSNSLYVSSVHVPNGTGDTLISTSVTCNKTVWGGSVQLGFNYYVTPSCFLGLSYTYSQTPKSKFNNVSNAAILNGFSAPGPDTLYLNRDLFFRVQEVMLSINKVL